MKNGAKRKGGRTAAGRAAARAEPPTPLPPPQESQPSQEAEEEATAPSLPPANEETQQQENRNAEEKKQKRKPGRRGKRVRASDSEKKEEDKGGERANKRARKTKADHQEDEADYLEEKRSLEDLWKAAFPVGAEWDELDALYGEFNWDFTNLEEAFEEGGKLYGKKVYVFGCAEPSLVAFEDRIKVIQVPVVVAIESPFPPSDKIGITSIQSAKEKIIPMKDMKMDWVPYILLEKRDRQVDGMKFQIFTLACTQRRAALKHLNEERVKEFKYCLPYFFDYFEKQDQNTSVPIVFPLEPPPPVVSEFDYKEASLEEFTDELIDDGELPAHQKEAFKEFVKEKVRAAKEAFRKAEEAWKKAIEDMSEETKQGFKSMKFYKFYPKPSPDTPDVAKSSLINRYYGNAHEVL